MVEQIYNEMKSQMDKTIVHYQNELSKIRTGTSNSEADSNNLDMVAK